MTLFLKIFKRATNSRANIYYTYAEGDALYTWREEKDEKRKSKYTFFLFLSLSLSALLYLGIGFGIFVVIKRARCSLK